MGGKKRSLKESMIRIKRENQEQNFRIPIMGSSVQFSSVAQSCQTLCNLMDCSTPGFPVHHQLPEFTQAHLHWVGDAIQPYHPLSSPSPPPLNLSQDQGLFKWVSPLHQVAKILDHELLIVKLRLKLKKVGKTTRPFRYDLNQIPYDYTVDVRVGLWRKLSAEELMLLNCGVGEDSWESLGLQGDRSSAS